MKELLIYLQTLIYLQISIYGNNRPRLHYEGLNNGIEIYLQEGLEPNPLKYTCKESASEISLLDHI